MEAHMMEVAKQQLEHALKINERYVGYGCVWLQSEPAGAQMEVDGAEILPGDAESLMLPIGPHDFEARWPDGQTAVRKVYVPQVKGEFNIDYDVDNRRGSRGGRGSIKFSGKPKIEKTVIVLAKPK
jgi:hypothetical protein